jgi:regulator of replication initiation timing
MTRNALIPTTSFEQLDSLDLQQLTREIGSLRAIIAELLVKNQNLRWELLCQGGWPVQDPS